MSEVLRATVKWYDQKRGFGFLFNGNGTEIWFHAADRRVPKFNYSGELEWLNAPSAEPVVGEVVVYLEGVDTQGRKKAIIWGHMYDGLAFLLDRESTDGFLKTFWGDTLYRTRAGTIVYVREGWGKIFEKRVDSVEFEVDPTEYIEAILKYTPPEHPGHQTRFLEGSRTYHVKGWYENFTWLEPIGYKYVEVRVEKGEGGTLAYDGEEGWNIVNLRFVERTEQGFRYLEAATHLYCNMDGSVSLGYLGNNRVKGSDFNPQMVPHTTKYLEELGISWKPFSEKTPVTKKTQVQWYFDEYCRTHRPTPEREAEILVELRERFGWGVYPPETSPAATIVVPVGSVYSDVAEDFGRKASEETKVALIGIYDPTAIKDWQDALNGGLVLRLNGSFSWGPGTYVTNSAGTDSPKLPELYNFSQFVRIYEKGHMTDHVRWQLLAYASDENGLNAFLKRFEALNDISGTGAIIVIGIEGQLGHTNVMG